MERAMTRSLSLPILQPRTYGDCITGTPLTGSREERMGGRVECQRLECRQNLRTVRSENVPGRRNHGKDPEWTLDGEANASAPSCALDVAHARRGIGYRCSELAEMFGKSKRRYQQEIKAALLRLEEECEARGITDKAIDAMRALMEEEARGK